MTSLAIRMSIVYGEALACSAIECAVAGEVSGSSAGREEGVAAFCTEEMLRVIRALAEPVGFTKRDVVLVRNGSLTVVALRSKTLMAL